MKLKVVPNSPESKIFEKEDHLEIHTKAPAKENKANIEVLKLLSKKYPGKKIKLKALKSKIKFAEIE